jgi:hypothetical protein
MGESEEKPHGYTPACTPRSFFFSKMRNIGIETWSFQGKSVGVDTVKLRQPSRTRMALIILLLILVAW